MSGDHHEPRGRHQKHVSGFLLSVQEEGYLGYLAPPLAMNRRCPACRNAERYLPSGASPLLRLAEQRLVCGTCGFTGGLLDGTLFVGSPQTPAAACRFFAHLIAELPRGLTLAEATRDLSTASHPATPEEVGRWVRVAQQLCCMATLPRLRGVVIAAFLKPSQFENPLWGVSDDDVDLLLLAEHNGNTDGRNNDKSAHLGSIRLLLLPPKSPVFCASALYGIMHTERTVGIDWGGIETGYQEYFNQVQTSVALIKTRDEFIKGLRKGLTAGLKEMAGVCTTTTLWETAVTRLEERLSHLDETGDARQVFNPRHACPPEPVRDAFAEVLVWMHRLRSLKSLPDAVISAGVETALCATRAAVTKRPEQVDLSDPQSFAGVFDDPASVIETAKAEFKAFVLQANPGALRKLFLEYAVEEFAFYRDNKAPRLNVETRLRRLLSSLGEHQGRGQALAVRDDRQFFGNPADFAFWEMGEKARHDLPREEVRLAVERLAAMVANPTGCLDPALRRKVLLFAYRQNQWFHRDDLDVTATPSLFWLAHVPAHPQKIPY
jgi:hypothetical protein